MALGLILAITLMKKACRIRYEPKGNACHMKMLERTRRLKDNALKTRQEAKDQRQKNKVGPNTNGDSDEVKE